MSTPTTASEEADQPQPEPLRWRPDDLIGRGRFRLVRFIAKGGMGIVWEAFDQKLHERVAVKTIPPDLRSNHPAFDHLRREIVRNRALSHPNIVRIHDLHEEEGEEPFIVMELVDGRGLDEWQREQADGIFDWEWLRPFLLQVCDALAYAHQRNIIHRDLKPANILLCRDGQIKIIDFGLATQFHDALHPMSRSLAASGTTAYMSPQQVEGWPSTAQDDIYALGATLFELLAGQPPFVGGDLAHQVANVAPQKLQERLDERGVQVTIPEEAETFVSACLTKDTAARPKSMEILVGLLRKSLETNSISKSDPDIADTIPADISISNDVQSSGSKRKMWTTLAVSVVTVVCGINVILFWQMHDGFRFFSPSKDSAPGPAPAQTASVADSVVQRIEVKIEDLVPQIGTSLNDATREPKFKRPCFLLFRKQSGQPVSLMLGPGRWKLENGTLSVQLDQPSDETYVFDSNTGFSELKAWSADVFVEQGTVLFGSHVITPAAEGQIDVLVSQLECQRDGVGPVLSETWRVDPSRLGGSTPHWYALLSAPWQNQGTIRRGNEVPVSSTGWNKVSVVMTAKARTFSVNGQDVAVLRIDGPDVAASLYVRIKGDASGPASIHFGNLLMMESSR